MLYLPVPLLLLHRSDNPVVWSWSHLHLFTIIFYLGFLFLCTFLFYVLDKVGYKYCFYLIAVYGLVFIGLDFMIGSMNYFSHLKLTDHAIYHHQLRLGKRKLGITDMNILDTPYSMSINEQGLRASQNIPYKKPVGHFRILALGDSFTEGEGVADENNFCYLVNHQLNQKASAGITYEVLNAGVDSYVPLLEYLYLKNKGILFEPDMVIVFYDMSDLIQTRDYLTMAEFDHDGNVIRVRPVKHTLSYNLDVFMKSRFYFVSKLYNSLNRRLFADKAQQRVSLSQSTNELLEYTLSADQRLWAKEWQRVFHDIENIHLFCQSRGIKFAVAIYPWGHQVSEHEWDVGREGFGIPRNYKAPEGVDAMLVSEFNRRHIPVLNLFEDFRNYNGAQRLYFQKDMHWTKEGHAFVAPKIASFIESFL